MSVTDQPLPKLTPRELDVLRLMCSGLTSYAELMEAMCVTENTLRYHMTELRWKLGVNRTAQIVAYALVHGMFEGESLEWMAGDEQAGESAA